jgi:hypothetical protein
LSRRVRNGLLAETGARQQNRHQTFLHNSLMLPDAPGTEQRS